MGEFDQVCSNCGTKRSEMGPAYNGAAQPSGQNNYGGGSYGGGNYGNGSYGNGNFGNGNFGNGGGMGMPPAQGMGMNAGGFQRRSGGNQIVAVIIALVVLLGVAGAVIFNSRPHKEDLGDFSVTFPERLKKDPDSVFAGSLSSDGEAYSNNKMGFAYMKYDLDELGVDASKRDGLEEDFLTVLNASFSAGLKEYSRKDQLNGNLRFTFSDGETRYFTVVNVKVHNEGLYVFMAYCNEENESKYIMKFREMLDSIDFK